MAAADSAPASQAQPSYWDAAPPADPAAAPVAPKFSGGAPAQSAYAQQAATANQQATDPQPVPGATPSYWDGGAPEKPAPPPQAAPPPAKTLAGRAISFGKGAVGQSNRALELLELAGASVPMLADKIHSWSSGKQQTGMQDAWFKNTVDPTIQNQGTFELGDDADFTDKALHGIGSTLMMIDQAIATGGRSAAVEGAFASTVGERLGVAAVTMSAPAAIQAVDVGRRVLDVTGDARAASVAGATAYISNTVAGMVPIGIGGNLATRVATAGATGVAMGEAQRQASNAAIGGGASDYEKRQMSDSDLATEHAKDTLRTPFDLQEVAIDALTTAPFGAIHSIQKLAARGLVPEQARESPANIMERSQLLAADEVRLQGGDTLDQTVAATHVNAVLGAHHDAAAYEGHLEVASQQADQMRLENDQEEAARSKQAAFELADKQNASAAPSADDAFTQHEQGLKQATDADFTKALNQKGDQDIDAAKNAQEGAEKGGASEPGPALADTLKPEELAQFKSLAERRAAQVSDDGVQQRLKAQNPEDNFSPFVPPAPKEGTKPPTTLAERRAQGTDLAPGEKLPAEPEPPAEGDAWVAKDGSTHEVLKENEDGTFTVRTTPADETQPPVRRKMKEAAVAILRARTEAPSMEKAAPAADEEASPDFPQKEAEAPAAQEPSTPTHSEPTVEPADEPIHNRTQSLKERRAERQAKQQQRASFKDQSGTAEPLSHAAAKEAVKPIQERFGKESLNVHKDSSTLPDHIKEEMAATGRTSVSGVYDPKTDQVHVVADAHSTPEGLRRTAAHEIVGHKGMRALLGDEWDSHMADMYRGRNKAADEWMKDYAAQHNNVDLGKPEGRITAADEYAAHLAEHLDENPSLLQRAHDTIRVGLRKLGFVREWSDNDINRLLRRSAGNLESEHAIAAREYRGDGPRFADKEDGRTEQLAPTNPLAQEHKFGHTMEEQANVGPGYVKSRTDFLKHAAEGVGNSLADKRDAALSFIHMRNLPDFMPRKLMPSLNGFIRLHDQMDGRRGQLMESPSKRLQDWSRWGSKNKEHAKNLGDLMHSSTLAGVDPSKPYEPRYSDQDKAQDAVKAAHDQMRKDFYGKAREMYRSLDDKGREMFNSVRDHYVQQRQDTYRALEDRINASGADEKTKKAVMAQLRKTFESNRVQGPYFPLMRYGDRWAFAKDKDGNTVSFSRFEKKSDQVDWVNNMKGRGYDVEPGQKMDDKSLMERIDPKFVQKVVELAKGFDKDLADEIWQTYLKAMPEMSMRKQFIHRVGRLGYTMNAMRNFASSSFHGAHQLARLEYGHRLDTALDSIKQEAAQTIKDHFGTSNAEWAPALAREMARRYEWIKNPRANPLASAITKFGFGWYLGAAPATAFRIFSQNPMIAQPVLAGYHGQIGATRELSRASAQWAMAKGDLGDKLRGDERAAFDVAKDRGVFSSTATQTLASGASDVPTTGKMATALKVAGYLFNAMEHHNRMTTYLAGYRLGRMQGMTHDQAIDHATDATWDSHFDYTNANRPRVLQGNVAKVLGLFKQYSWGVTYRLARDARNMLNSDLPSEERTRAAKTLGGMLLRVSMMSGVTGLPLAWIATAAINAAMHDKDKPFDAEGAAHGYLKAHLGNTAADAIMTGPAGAISGASLSGGASYSDLWYRPPSRDENAHDTGLDALAQLGGAIPAIPLNMLSGVGMMADGNVERGIEHFMPPEAAALMKAHRYSKEGATTLSGEQIVGKPKGDIATNRNVIDDRNLFLQAIGFTPQKVADMYRENSALKNISKAITDRRQKLMETLATQTGMGDHEEMANTMKDIENFNKTNPGVAIQAKGLISSMKNHFMNQAEAINGLKLPPGLSSLRDTYAPQEPP